MCGRFFVPEDDSDETIVRIVEAADARAARLDAGHVARGEVFPTQTVAALAPSRHGGPAAYPLRWGFQLDDGRSLINTRSETADVKPLFREAFRLRRCLIPAAHYFEWERGTGPDGKPLRRKHALRPAWAGPVWLAGIYRFEPGQALPALSILTRDADPAIAFIHPRMPVICPSGLIDTWLDPNADPRTVTGAPQPMIVVE